MADFEVKIATEPGEIEEAQRLRFEVFNLELNKGLQESYARGLDIDEFDPFCQHLIVRHLKSGDVVGTYRLLLGSQARRHIGFYSEKEFDLSRIKMLDGELLELGRSCARKDYRDRALVPLMWEAITAHARQHKARYAFGCGSLYTTGTDQVSAMFALLKKKYYAPEAQRVMPLEACRFKDLAEDFIIENEPALFQKLPGLIKGYLRAGAVVCGLPALDAEFGTADFFVMLDFAKSKKEYFKRLGMAAEKGNDAPA
ncbi:MAG: GNAT family N-acetyltransferase [Deltaproteobacteria bacterium]|nr:GNAT family N-acetyltransferase [Deltaproteobacteria bacterium]